VDLEEIIKLDLHPLTDAQFRSTSRKTLAHDGVLVMRDFLTRKALETIRSEGEQYKHHAYYVEQEHNVYLMLPDPDFESHHPRNRTVVSSKGCITDDVIPSTSPLRTLYDSGLFRDFLCAVLDEKSLYEYADPLSSINIHYAKPGQELGWHFDNSSFAITLMIEEPESGGTFEYVSRLRDTNKGDMNFEGVEKILSGHIEPKTLAMNAGSLVLFRGRDAIHRVTPVLGARTRMLVVLAYNVEPGVSLSESARMTFYGRLQ
jgi:hypothetical protein